MASLLGWSDEVTEREKERYRAEVALSRAWRATLEPADAPAAQVTA